MRAAVIDRTLARTSGRLQLDLLGGFSLRVDAEPVDVPEGSQRVLVHLALHERAQSRQHIAGSLWPDSTERRATANLRAALWRLPPIDHGRLVEAHGQMLAIDPDVAIDVREVEAAGWSVVRSRGDAIVGDYHNLLFDDLLPGWYDDDVVLERERLAQLRVHFLEATAWSLLRQGRLTEALDVALRLVAADPLRERSQRALIGVYRAEGSLGQAKRQLTNYRHLLVEAFGCEPSRELVELATGIDVSPAESITSLG